MHGAAGGSAGVRLRDRYGVYDALTGADRQGMRAAANQTATDCLIGNSSIGNALAVQTIAAVGPASVIRARTRASRLFIFCVLGADSRSAEIRTSHDTPLYRAAVLHTRGGRGRSPKWVMASPPLLR